FETTTSWYATVRGWPTATLLKFMKASNKTLKLLGLGSGKPGEHQSWGPLWEVGVGDTAENPENQAQSRLLRFCRFWFCLLPQYWCAIFCRRGCSCGPSRWRYLP